MKNKVQELHNQYNIYDEDIDLYLIHEYDRKKKSWSFSGYQCRHCGSGMKYASSIEKHPELCKVLNKKVIRAKEDPNIMLTTQRTQWEPLYRKYTNISN